MNEFIVKNNMDFLISKINNKQYFRFPKLLHGFWERIEFLSEGSDDIEVVKNNIKKIGKNFGRRNFEKPPWRSDFFKSNSSLGVGPHYLDIIDLLQKEDENILWGIGEKAFNIKNNFIAERTSIKWIKRLVKSKYVDGCFWKDAISLDLIASFFNAIKDLEVVIIGMKHLKNINHVLKFNNFHYIEVTMPLANKLEEFQKELEQFHKSISKPTVYLSQMSIDGIPIVCKADLPNSFFFDFGRALDVFGEKSFEYDWEKSLPDDVKIKYKNEKNKHREFL